MPSGPIDFTTLLIDLVTAKVDFIVVGGIAASLQGAPIHTIDLGREKNRAMLKTLEDTQGELSRDESSN